MTKRIRTPKGNDPVRPCGGCTRCCVTLAIEELEKPFGVACSYLAPESGGCTQYETRPQSCRDFECMWRKGLGSTHARPDKIGVMFCTTANGSALVAMVEPGGQRAWKRGESGDIIKWHIDNGVPVFVVDNGQRHTLMPKRSHMSDDKLQAMKHAFINDDSLPVAD